MESLVRRYGRWQVRDFAVERGVWIAALGAALLALFWLNYDPSPEFLERMRAVDRAAWLAGEPQRFRRTILSMFGIFGFVGTLIATHGIVARDRERGFYRFLFAKPVDMVAYYAQAFAVSAVGLMAITAGLLGAAAVAFGRAVPLAPVGVVATEFALLGGTVFLLSALWRFDFVLAALSWPVSLLAVGLADEQWGRAWARLATLALPPVAPMFVFIDAASGPKSVDLIDPLTVFGYAALCVAGALYALRRRAGAG